MKIVGVSTVKDEPWIGDVITHMRDQGVDDIFLSVDDDETGWKALGAGAEVYESCDGPFDQGAEITALARQAAWAGADWIIPFDADEYWQGVNGLTIRDALTDADGLQYVYAPMFLHLTRELRSASPKPLPKVAFRPFDGMTVAWGSHDVRGLTGPGTYGLLEVRELQYRDWDHFLAKIDKARALHEQPHMDHEHGSHMWRLCQMTTEELRAEWAAHVATPTVIDPIQ